MHFRTWIYYTAKHYSCRILWCVFHYYNRYFSCSKNVFIKYISCAGLHLENPESEMSPETVPQDDNRGPAVLEQLDNYTENIVCENDLNSPVITTNECVNFSFPYDEKSPDINFYLKNSCDALTKNINVNADIDCSKTEKELFKVFQKSSDTNSSFENISTSEENVS